LGTVVIVFAAILLLINFKTTFFGQSTIGLILEYDGGNVSKSNHILYGYEINGISYVDNDSYSSFQSAKEGDCIEIRHSNNYPFESVSSGKCYDCEHSNKSIVYGDLKGKNSDDTVFVFMHSETEKSLKKFVTDGYYFVLDTGNIYRLNFHLKNHREKVLLLDLNRYEVPDKEDSLFTSSKINWILNLDANFIKGQGSDTARFAYSPELDDIVPEVK